MHASIYLLLILLDARTHLKSGRWSEMKGERSLEEEEVKSRSKRGTCTGQTGLFGILFGVAYQPNIDCVNQELEKFRGDVSGNIDNIKVIQNRMGNEHNKEMRETKSMVHKVRRLILEIGLKS